MVIDSHAHIIVPQILRDATPHESWRPAVSWQDGQQVIEFAGKQIRSAVREFVDVERILAAQDEAGIDRILLAPWVSILRYNASVEDGLRASRIQNEALTAIAQRFPQRISALGTVPLQDPALAADEIGRLMQTGGMVGVEVAASVNGDYLGDSRFRPFWEAAAQAQALVFIHPTTRGFDLPVLDEYYLWNTVGNPLETAITAAHIVMSGLMEQLPGLKVLLAHGGGALLALRGRLQHAHSFQPQTQAVLREAPEDSLRRFYYDSLTHDPPRRSRSERAAVPDHVLLGSDYPFDMGDAQPAEMLRSLGLSAADEARILHENAARLMGI